MKQFVVFYAWQSDTVERLNRHLIRFALNLAAKNISDDPVLRVRARIDADTEGILGHVPVTDTILKKIAACDAFVPDLTFVAVTKAGKLIPNPNVMLEYGFALRAKSYSVMIPVMNTAYGPAEKLPFDMAHLRHPLQYRLPATAENSERRTVRKALTEEFERILRLMIAAVPAAQTTPFKEARSVASPAFYFPRGAAIATFGRPGEQEYQFDGDQAIYLRLFPKYDDGQPKPGRANLRSLLHDRRVVNPMSLAIGSIASANDYGWVVIDPRDSNTTRGITQAFPTGELWGINSQAFVPVRSPPEAAATAIGVISAEKLYARALENYASAATLEMKVKPPFIVEVGAVGLKGVYMGAPHREFSSGHYYGPIREASLVRRYDLQDSQHGALLDVLRQFLDEFYDLAECSRSYVLTEEHVRSFDIPPRT
ncbi:MAG: hypothetical protein WBF03_10105 [Xanthobacteraceae bacterium]